MRKKDVAALGYGEVEHAGFFWLANEEGARFVTSVENWSAEGLMVKGWNPRKKRDHEVYIGRGNCGGRYLIKFYPPPSAQAYFFSSKANKAEKEFSKTLSAHGTLISTILPIAMAEGQTDRRRGIIIYPFLDQAIPLERVYDQRPNLTIHEKLCVEREVGKLVRIMNDAGIYPVDAHLDHFLAVRSEQGTVSVKYIDFERIHFRRFSGRWLRRVRLIRSLGRLLARLEWLRASGGRINRSAMMRMARACLMTEMSSGLDKQLLRAVIRSAKKFWHRREFNTRGVYEFRSFKPSG